MINGENCQPDDMLDYYAKRAAEYERIYAKPERQADLKALRLFVAERLAGRHVLEVACGTGYWTEIYAPFARSVTATDLSEEVLEIARSKILPVDRVHFQLADSYALNVPPGRHDAAFGGFWWSHIPRSRITPFLRELDTSLAPGSRLLFIDNRYVEGSSTPISRSDGDDNTYQVRRLDNGETFEVLKNFPSELELREAVRQLATEVEMKLFQYYWALTFVTS